MHIDLSGKKAVVTGSSRGIGLAIARGLALAGAQLVMNSRSENQLEKAREGILQEIPGAKIHTCAADLGSAEGCAFLVRSHPSCDILVNNVGIYGTHDFFDISDKEWDTYFQINVMSGVRLSRAYAEGMEHKKWGRIIFIASESGFNIPGDMIHYGFSKTANISIARGLAKRLAGTGVTVNSVLPGPTLSDGLQELLADKVQETGDPMEKVAARFVMENRSSSIIRRAARVEEVANMVVYASSEQASATTGASLRVDGGVVEFL